MKHIHWKRLLVSLAIPLGVGGLSALLTRDGIDASMFLQQPPFAPPPAAFPIVWTVLFLLMGFACYRIWTAPTGRNAIRTALTAYGLQLLFNFTWSLIFFRWEAYGAAFLWLVALWLLIFRCWRLFRHIDTLAGWCLGPYLLWVAFAGYLNLGIWFLN